MERIAYIKGVTYLDYRTIIDDFSETVNQLLTVKRTELRNLEFERCELIDAFRNDEFLKVYLVFFDSVSGYKKLNSEVKRMSVHVRRKKHGGEMVILPLEEVKRIPILDVFEFKNIKRTGRRVMVSCPHHEDNSPSMLINNNNTFKCFSCGKSGSVVDFIKDLYGFTFIEAVKKLQGYLNEIK